jgi:hypothetical protein
MSRNALALACAVAAGLVGQFAANSDARAACAPGYRGHDCLPRQSGTMTSERKSLRCGPGYDDRGTSHCFPNRPKGMTSLRQKL